MSEVKRGRGRPPNDGPQSRTQIERSIAQSRRRWEYTTLSSEQPIRASLYDDYGADGWELVSVYVRMDAVHAVFKREVL